MEAKRSLREILDERKAKREGIMQQAEPSTVPIVAPPPERLSIAERRLARQNKGIPSPIDRSIPATIEVPTEPKVEANETFSLSIELNDKQMLARDMAMTGKSFCYIGAAGSGKTTGLREIVKALLATNKLGTHTFKVQGTKDYKPAPSIALIAWTRIASGNARRAIHKDPVLKEMLPHNITTAHNLLEFQPEWYFDEVTGKDTMRFIPMRTRHNTLDITHLIIEEASLIDLPMWSKIYEALRPGVQIIFVGDINQLPPVFGPSILNYALTDLPTVELTHIYRQADDSMVLENAHRILEGRELQVGKGFEIIQCGAVEHSQEHLSVSLGKTFPKWQEIGKYDPKTDIILSPWNVKDLGTDVINKWIAQRLGTERNAVVHQVLAGRFTHYLAEGDKIMYNKQIGEIVKINKNPMYMGTPPLEASASLTRFGAYIGKTGEAEEFGLAGYDNIDIEKMLDDSTDVSKQCSHTVELVTEDGLEFCLDTIGDMSASSFSLGYALTIHKAQGCEWRRVFIVMHKDHSRSLSREMLYTAVTRAREECIVISKEYLINKTISQQRLKGNTLKEKIDYFNTGLLNKDDIQCTK